MARKYYWPTDEQVIDLANELITNHRQLHAFLKFCEKKMQKYNFMVFRHAMPDINDALEMILVICRNLLRFVPNRSGPRPKWSKVVEDIIAITLTMRDQRKEMLGEIRAGNWKMVELLIQQSLTLSREIRAQLALIEFRPVNWKEELSDINLELPTEQPEHGKTEKGEH